MAHDMVSKVIEVSAFKQAMKIASGRARSQILKRHGRELAEAKALRQKLAQYDSRIRALPQELQDIILDYTIFSQPSLNNIIPITRQYKPPLGLQVNRHTRARFAKAYYGGSIFHVGSPKHPRMRLYRKRDRDAADWICQIWLATLHESDRKLIHTIRLDEMELPPSEWYTWPSFEALLLAVDEFGEGVQLHFGGYGRRRMSTKKFHIDVSVLVFRIDDDEWHRCRPL